MITFSSPAKLTMALAGTVGTGFGPDHDLGAREAAGPQIAGVLDVGFDAQAAALLVERGREARHDPRRSVFGSPST